MTHDSYPDHWPPIALKRRTTALCFVLCALRFLCKRKSQPYRRETVHPLGNCQLPHRRRVIRPGASTQARRGLHWLTWFFEVCYCWLFLFLLVLLCLGSQFVSRAGPSGCAPPSGPERGKTGIPLPGILPLYLYKDHSGAEIKGQDEIFSFFLLFLKWRQNFIEKGTGLVIQ